MQVVALACLPVLAIACLGTPHLIARWRGARLIEDLEFAGIVAVAGLLPLTLGILSLRRIQRGRSGVEWVAWLAILGGGMNLLAVPVAVNVLTNRAAHEYGVSHSMTRCASNLRQIGMLCLLYSNDHRGHLPDSVRDLFISGDIEPQNFTCDLSNDTGVTTFAELEQGGHVSYDYTGAGFTSETATEKVVIAYEHPSNHDEEGLPLNVLYGDGHTESLGKAELERVIREIESGHNPPRPR